MSMHHYPSYPVTQLPMNDYEDPFFREGKLLELNTK